VLYRRWQESMDAQNRRAELDGFKEALEALLNASPQGDLPFVWNTKNNAWQSPLGDLLTLHHLDRIRRSEND
jgi:hypothetical protein